MGKGDRKSRKGKIFLKSYGNVRPHSDKAKVAGPATTAASAKPAVTKSSAAKSSSAAKPAAAKPAAAKPAAAKPAAAKKAAPAKKKV